VCTVVRSGYIGLPNQSPQLSPDTLGQNTLKDALVPGPWLKWSDRYRVLCLGCRCSDRDFANSVGSCFTPGQGRLSLPRGCNLGCASLELGAWTHGFPHQFQYMLSSSPRRLISESTVPVRMYHRHLPFVLLNLNPWSSFA
jgi:hypothetical protein